MTCLVSPCERNAVESRSDCCGARGHARRRPAALHVEDHTGNLGVVAEPGKLGHQRDARARSRGHGPRAGPARAQHHADGRQLVLGLHHGKGRLALRRHAEFLQQIGRRLNQRRRRRDGIPRHHRHAREHRAHAASRVAVDDDLACGLVHRLDAVRVLLGKVGPRVVVSRLHSAEVQVEDLLLFGKLLVHAFSTTPRSMRSSCATTPTYTMFLTSLRSLASGHRAAVSLSNGTG